MRNSRICRRRNLKKELERREGSEGAMEVSESLSGVKNVDLENLVLFNVR